MKVTDRELGTTAFVTVTVDTTEGDPEHVPLVKRSYATVPLAWKLLVIVAESETELPTVMTVCERLELIAGAALFTVRGSQGLVDALLLESPL